MYFYEIVKKKEEKKEEEEARKKIDQKTVCPHMYICIYMHTVVVRS
jgi:hypothetical protein